MKTFLYSAALCATVGFCCEGKALAAESVQHAKPNIILVMTDDQGWGDVGYNGHPFVQTPALDAMAKEGFVFDRFYAGAPVCSPTRASVMTGRHPMRCKVTNHGRYMRPHEQTLAEVLKSAGYVTGMFGKVHLGSGQPDSPCNPSGMGFDEWVIGLNFFDNDPYLSRNGKVEHRKGKGSVLLMDDALAFLKKHKDAERPLFTVIWFPSPHDPHLEVPEGPALYEGKPEAEYYREITLLDQQVGRLRGELKDMGLADNTIVWYCSDNGGLVHETAGGREMKGSIYEGGLRVPGIIEWPARKLKGRTSVPVSTADIFPTLLAMAGVQVVPPHPLDGIDVSDIIDGTSTKRAKPIGFWHNFQEGQSTHSDKILKEIMEKQKAGAPLPHNPERMCKDVNEFPQFPEDSAKGHAAWNDWPWKLHRINGTTFELYNLVDDPMETKDLSRDPAYQERLERMKAEQDGWMRSVIRSLNGKDYGQNSSLDNIYEGFKTPPPEARPFVRWWWNHNQVEEKEILRELDVLKAAGVGGVEINPIAGKEKSTGSKAEILPWRSEAWDRMVHVACKGAKERGMVVDLIAGSGWPFGGQFLKPDERIMRVKVITDTVKGPLTFRKTTADIFSSTYEGYHNDRVKFINPSVSFISVYPKNLTSLEQVKDVTGLINQDGILQVDVGQGEYVVAYGVREQGFRTVFHGAKGADGPTMDHLNKNVTRAYLNRLKGVEDTWKEPLSKYVRAIFCDSIETDGANWTHDIIESFEKSMGYDIKSYLPFVIGPEDASLSFAPQMTDRLRRARYDWNKHVATVFLSNFSSEYAAFCREHQLQSRYQAYGNPDLMAMPEGYMIPDIPESNNWLYQVDPYAEGRFTWFREQGYMLWNKYASAGGNLRGKKIVSSEAMTNSKKVFHTTLGSIKQADDMNFITGITHSVLHGYNYVPPDVPFPGWIRYGTFFSEYNTWWPYFTLWAKYNARLSYVFQETKAVNEIALLGPTPDIWSKTGLHREEFHLTPDYFHQLWEPIAQLGAGCDYLHETVIQQAHVENDQLICGKMAYQVLLVAEMDSMMPETAEAIQRFAEAGCKVIFVNRPPNRSPGLVNAAVNDRRVREATDKLLKTKALCAPRPELGATTAALRKWLVKVLDEVTWKPRLNILQPKDGLYAARRQGSGEELFFFANSYRKESARTQVAVKLGNKGLWRWNPETGERTPYELSYNEEGFEIALRPLESLLLVTGNSTANRSRMNNKLISLASENRENYEISTPWTVEFAPIRSDARFTTIMDTLSDFTESKDVRVKTFSGTATYTTTFMLGNPSFTELDLGWDNDFISEVTLNGTKLGVNWYGSRRFAVGGIVKKGSNALTIRYTTALWNGMGKTPLQPSGLIGPVKLLAATLGTR